MQVMKIRSMSGFTLVEMAIVLVSVGLLLGGVLKGQELITNTKLKRIVSDSAAINVAVLSYQDRYHQRPGDDSRASERFSVYDPADPVNGNSNGIIDGNWDEIATTDITAVATPTAETNMFYAHLRAAGLMAGHGKDDTKPTNAYGGLVGVRHGTLGLSGLVVIFGQIEGNIGQIIESRLDDGFADQGRIQAGISSGAAPIDMNTAPAGSLFYDSSERYNIAFRM